MTDKFIWEVTLKSSGRQVGLRRDRTIAIRQIKSEENGVALDFEELIQLRNLLNALILSP